MSAPHQRLRTRKGAVCTVCRQLKLRCDSADRHPEKCSRCTKTGKQCSIDPLFRREPRRKRVHALEEQLENTNQELLKLRAKGRRVDTDVSLESQTAHPFDSSHARLGFVKARSYDTSFVVSQSLSGVDLEATDIIYLIEKYYEAYHQHFPILPDLEAFWSKYNHNQLLLWTILAIASKDSDRLPTVYFSLVEPVRRLAADLHGPQSRTFETLQALIMLCVWPFPYQQTINDPSPLYSSLAVNIAHQCGLHRPAFRQDFQYGAPCVGEAVIMEMKKAWYSCFFISQCLAQKLGFPSTVTPDHCMLVEIARGAESDTPGHLSILLHIAYVMQKAVAALGDSTSTPSGLNSTPDLLVDGFVEDLDNVKLRFHHSWTNVANIYFNANRLQLLSFVINTNMAPQYSDARKATRQANFVSAYSTILEVVNETEQNHHMGTAWPVFVKYSMFYAVIIGLRMVAQLGDRQDSRITLLDACRRGNAITRTWSMFPNDHFSRMSAHMQEAIGWLETSQEDRKPHTAECIDSIKKKTRIQARMAANILYDTVWTAKYSRPQNECAHALESGLRAAVSHSSPTVNTFDSSSKSVDSAKGHEVWTGLDQFSFVDDLGDTALTDIWMDWQALQNSL